MDTDWDVIVVGSGPAGIAAAVRLRELGIDVLLVDRESVRTGKPCGGGLTPKALQLLPWSVSSIIRHETREITFGLSRGSVSRSTVFRADRTVCTFVERSEFDALNLENAQQRGVPFRRIAEVTAIQSEPGRTTLSTSTGRLSARYLIGCDGANSSVRRLLAGRRGAACAFAIEGVANASGMSLPLPCEVTFGQVRSGYGWIFPKNDHVNVGLYTSDPRVKLSKAQLRAYLFERMSIENIDNIKGFPLCTDGGRMIAPRDGVLLAGDAAGMTEALLGEGIHNALFSGRAAAEAIIAAIGEPMLDLAAEYRRRLRALHLDLRRYELMRKAFYSRFDRAGFAVLSLPFVRRAFMQGYAEGKTMLEITNGLFIPSFPRYREVLPGGA
jgi:geranylgeranyl reductase family protein